jgi:quercetin dioxygenase-like cupin family protein
MSIVTEIIDGFPGDRALRVIQRREPLLFQKPEPGPIKMREMDAPPLPVYKFISQYEPVRFAPPRGVFEGPALRLEWQTINGRQPFYHRNTDVEEIGFQIWGERTQMTELGTIELRPGQFSCIPVGIAHDNYGREDIHLILYFHGPVQACVPASVLGEYKNPVFPGWEPKTMLEVTTYCLGGPHCDVALGMVDEVLLLQTAQSIDEQLPLHEPPGVPGKTEWLYKAPKVWIGHTVLEAGSPRVYTRHMCADEIQYQFEGTRTLITQRGVVTLEPGEFVSIPFGCAFTSVTNGGSKHVSVLTSEPTPAVPQPVRTADLNILGALAAFA